MPTNSNWLCHIRALIQNEKGQTLLQETASGWELPSAELKEYVSPMGSPLIAQAFNPLLNGQFFPLYCVWFNTQAEFERGQRIYQLEPLQTQWQPPKSFTWVSKTQINKLHLADSNLSEIIIKHQTVQNSTKRAAWTRNDWHTQVENWINEQLKHLDITPSSRPHLIKSWGISCVLKIPTNRGDIYFKAACFSPLFGNEAQTTQHISKLFPTQIPSPLAINIKNNWLLLSDFGDELEGNEDLGLRKLAIRNFAKLQIASIPHKKSLLENSCLDRQLGWLTNQIDKTVNSAKLAHRLTPEDLHALKQAAPKLKAVCQQLAQLNIPATLTHGDLHEGNIAAPNGNPLYFDWTDAAVAHPFMDGLIFILDEVETSVRQILLEAYLEPWIDFSDENTIKHAWQLAKPLCAFNQIISYLSITAHHNDGAAINQYFMESNDTFVKIILEELQKL